MSEPYEDDPKDDQLMRSFKFLKRMIRDEGMDATVKWVRDRKENK